MRDITKVEQDPISIETIHDMVGEAINITSAAVMTLCRGGVRPGDISVKAQGRQRKFAGISEILPRH